jgi:hypothetical protein
VSKMQQVEMIATGDNVLFTPYMSTLRSATGLILPGEDGDDSRGMTNFFFGKVVSCGPEVKEVQVGEIVVIGPYSQPEGIKAFDHVTFKPDPENKNKPSAFMTGDEYALGKVPESSIFARTLMEEHQFVPQQEVETVPAPSPIEVVRG